MVDTAYQLIQEINDISNNNITLEFCDQLTKTIRAFSIEEQQHFFSNIPETIRIKTMLLITIGFETYDNFKAVVEENASLYYWLSQNSLFVFFTSFAQDTSQDPKTLIDDFFIDPTNQKSSKKILKEIIKDNAVFVTTLKNRFNEIQLYIWPQKYESYIFDTYLPTRPIENDINQNLIDLAVVNPSIFCQFLNNDLTTAISFSSFDKIAARSADALYQIFDKMRNYSFCLKGLFISLVKLGNKEFIVKAIAECDNNKMPIWLSGLGRPDWMSLYESALEIFDAIVDKYHNIIIILLKSKVLAIENENVYLAILQRYIAILPLVEYFSIAQTMSAYPELINKFPCESEKHQVFYLYQLLSKNNLSEIDKQLLTKLASKIDEKGLLHYLELIFSICINIKYSRLVKHFAIQLTDILFSNAENVDNETIKKLGQSCDSWESLSQLLSALEQQNPIPQVMLHNVLLFPCFLQHIKLNIEAFYYQHKSIFITLLGEAVFLNIVKQSIAGYRLTTQEQLNKFHNWINSLLQENVNLPPQIYDNNFSNEIKKKFIDNWFKSLAELALNDNFLFGLNCVAKRLNALMTYRFLEKYPKCCLFVLKKLHNQQLEAYPYLASVMQAPTKPSWVNVNVYEVGEETIKFLLNAQDAARNKKILHVVQPPEGESITITSRALLEVEDGMIVNTLVVMPESRSEILHGEQQNTLFADSIKKGSEGLNSIPTEAHTTVLGTFSSWMGWK